MRVPGISYTDSSQSQLAFLFECLEMRRVTNSIHHGKERLAPIFQGQDFRSIAVLAFFVKFALYFYILGVECSGCCLRGCNRNWRNRGMGPEQVEVGISHLRAEVVQICVTPGFDFVPDLQWRMGMTAGDRNSAGRVLNVEHRRGERDDTLDRNGA